MKVPQIDINPLRVLGVYANSTLREIEQNKAQLRAFARVGQKVEFPLWLRGLSLLLPMGDIDEEMLNQAQSQISLPEDRNNYARFWFERGDEKFAQDDEKFIALLNNHQVEEACELLKQRTDHAAYKNLLLLYVMKPDWRGVADCASKCFEGDVNEFRLFMDEVIKASNTANSDGSHLLLYHFRDDFWKAEMRKLLINNHKRVLDGVIERLKHVPKDDANLLKNAYEKASEDKQHLKALLNLNGEESMIYQFYLGEIGKAMCTTLYRYALLLKYRAHEIRWACQEFETWWGFVKKTDPDYSDLRPMKTYMDRANRTFPRYGSSKSNSQNSSTSTIFDNTGAATTSKSTIDKKELEGCSVQAVVAIALIILLSIVARFVIPGGGGYVKYKANNPQIQTSIQPNPSTSARPVETPQPSIIDVQQSFIDDLENRAITAQSDEKLDLDGFVAQKNALYYSEIEREWKLNLPDSLMKKMTLDRARVMIPDIIKSLMDNPEYQNDVAKYLRDLYIDAHKYDWRYGTYRP